MVFISKNKFVSHDLNDETTQTWAALSLSLVVILLGIPIWWKSTEVYRASLPFDDIDTFNENLNFGVSVTVKINIDDAFFVKKETFQSDLSRLLTEESSSGFVQFKYIFSSILNRNIANHINITLKNQEASTYNIKIGNDRSVICFINQQLYNNPNEFSKFQRLLSSTIREVIINEHLLQAVVSNIFVEGSQSKYEDNLMKMVQTNPRFELLFSLLCPEPHKQIATWDIENAFNSYMEPMISKLSPIFDFSIGSQILYYTDLVYRPKAHVTDKKITDYYFLTHDKLSHIINPIEGRLGSQISSNPTLNFVVYLTEEKFTPLFIQKSDGSFSKTNSFLMPRWGAFLFYNNLSKNKTTEIDMRSIFDPFMEQFRVLLGLQKYLPIESVHFESLGSDGLSNWELDFLFRLRTLENLATSIHTLGSLSKLLNKISNMVIKDEVALEVYKSVEQIKIAMTDLENGHLKTAFFASKKGFSSSENAFFDSSLLELLYFPEDEKFAIYIPLFLPISLPLIMSLFHAVKRIRNSKNKSLKTKSE